ncbi:tripartite ATP-independent transporter DctP family solute receptor [Tamaricihabitans halophyticus]|uniref:Tripartite ATP-independent transporter DctP family solute receptor n=1 Tax=Tamaricihabitans halophyticus TaxID=1262583 RepID=A0A4R2Q9J7_9PSEU|nr:TRAP transporter substrate-binding protein [Tamaricihabitans halophyticus]TCP43435.1 tripartite ATP-independent transporter DctP family solute receptor [Tamaricihabitans halophyticus]
MNRRKPARCSLGAVAAVAMLSLSGCAFLTGEQSGASGNGECDERTLRLATIRAEDDPTTIGANTFAESVQRATGGQLTVQVFPNSQLGDANDVFAGMSSGQEVDIFYNGISLYPTLEGAEAFTVLSVPFLWDSYEQLRAVLNTQRYQELIDDAAEATGVRVVATEGDAEPRALSANRPVRTADDMRGLDLRIAEAPMPQEFARALGARPQVVALSDLYLSLHQGVVDAQENGAITMVNQSLMEVQSHFMSTDYIRDVQAWYFSDQVWNSLCAPQQQAIKAEAAAAGEVVTGEVSKQLDEARNTLRGQLEIVEVDTESFRTALSGVFDQFDGEMWPAGLLAETRQLAAEHS